MNNLAIANNRIMPSSEAGLNSINKLSDAIKAEMPLINFDTHHVLHGGMYSRTIKIPKNGLVVGSFVKLATILITQGDILVYGEDKNIELHGYNVFACSANRKQACYALTESYVSMLFPTKAKTIAEAEAEFTDEPEKLLSRENDAINVTTITGE